MATRLTRTQRTQLNRGAAAANQRFARSPGIAQFGNQAAGAVRDAVRNRMSPQQIRANYQAGVAAGAGPQAQRAYRTAFRSYGVNIPTEA